MKATLVLQQDSKYNLKPEVKSVIFSQAKHSATHFLARQNLTAAYIHVFRDQVDSKIHSKISTLTDTIGDVVKAQMTDALSAIPERGKLTKNLIFIFSGTPKGLQYPSDQAGVQYRVLGKFMYDDEKAPGDIGVVPFPSIPTDREATFHINKYEFNAIFWALYKAGYLHLTLDKSNVPFQPAMNTSYYS